MRISIDYVDHLAHRLAWLYMTDEWPSQMIDHRDGDPFNNRWGNLRDVSNSTNMENQRSAQRRNKVGVLGVSYSEERKKFVAQIKYGGKNRHLGRFETLEDARQAYLAAKRQHHEGCTI